MGMRETADQLYGLLNCDADVEIRVNGDDVEIIVEPHDGDGMVETGRTLEKVVDAMCKRLEAAGF